MSYQQRQEGDDLDEANVRHDIGVECALTVHEEEAGHIEDGLVSEEGDKKRRYGGNESAHRRHVRDQHPRGVVGRDGADAHGDAPVVGLRLHRIAKNSEPVGLVGEPNRTDQQQPVAAVGVEGGESCKRGKGNGASEDARHQQGSDRQ
jgi:hypothetical protein